jgi:hypothetical protein
VAMRFMVDRKKAALPERSYAGDCLAGVVLVLKYICSAHDESYGQVCRVAGAGEGT